MSNPRAAYHAARYQAKKAADPLFLKKNAERQAEQRKKFPEKTKEWNAARRAADPEKERARVRDWFAKNQDKRVAYEANRRAKRKALTGIVSPDIRTKLMKLQRGKCACCAACLIKTTPHLDHRVSLTKGGAHDDANLQLLCALCNNQKYNKDPIDFMHEKGFLL